jgi:hypothetical protein
MERSLSDYFESQGARRQEQQQQQHLGIFTTTSQQHRNSCFHCPLLLP